MIYLILLGLVILAIATSGYCAWLRYRYMGSRQVRKLTYVLLWISSRLFLATILFFLRLKKNIIHSTREFMVNMKRDVMELRYDIDDKEKYERILVLERKANEEDINLRYI